VEKCFVRFWLVVRRVRWRKELQHFNGHVIWPDNSIVAMMGYNNHQCYEWELTEKKRTFPLWFRWQDTFVVFSILRKKWCWSCQFRPCVQSHWIPPIVRLSSVQSRNSFSRELRSSRTTITSLLNHVAWQISGLLTRFAFRRVLCAIVPNRLIILRRSAQPQFSRSHMLCQFSEPSSQTHPLIVAHCIGTGLSDNRAMNRPFTACSSTSF
jgi:hypothetical protein